jgi:UDP-glucose 4-epimerase
MRFLLIGGAGFVGIHLARCLLQQNHSVSVLDNLSNSTGVDVGVDSYTGDVANESVVDSIVSKVNAEVIVWLVAFHSYRAGQYPFVQEAWYTHCLSRAIPIICRVKPRCFVLASTDLVYKPSKGLIKETSQLQWGSPSPLIMNRLMSEWYTSTINQSLKNRFIILRLSNIVGNRQFVHPAADPLTFMIDSLLIDTDLVVTKGQQRRDYLHIDIAVELISNVISHEKSFGVYNISSGIGISNRELLHAVNAFIGTKQLPKVVDSREGNLVLSHAKALKLGSVNFFPAEDKLEEIINFRRQVLEG